MAIRGMKAATAPMDLRKMRLPKYGSTKINGVRGIVVDGVLMSYNMKPIVNDFTQAMFGRTELNGFDGEIVVGAPNDHNSLRNTMSAITRHHGECDVHFYLFDNYLLEADYHRRYENLLWQRDTGKWHGVCDRLVVVEQKVIATHETLEEFEEDVLNRGFEGIMLRRIDGRYKFGRSTPGEDDLWKVKRFVDAEAVVIGFEEGMHNANELQVNELGKAKRTSHKENKVPKGTLGGLLVRGVNGQYKGIEYRVGLGFDQLTAQEIWNNQDTWLGKIVKVKYFPVGNLNKPAHTSFEGEFLGERPEGM
jgi:DNA ligase-1